MTATLTKLVNGEIVAMEPEEQAELLASIALPPQRQIEDFRAAIQRHVDATARARSYDSGASCASYLGSTVTTWANEAAAFVAWRDAVWVHAYLELDKVTAGQRPQPTIAELLAELPAIAWPG